MCLFLLFMVDPIVSTKHCVIWNGSLEDVGSSNGTWLNGDKVRVCESCSAEAFGFASCKQANVFCVDTRVQINPKQKYPLSKGDVILLGGDGEDSERPPEMISIST